MPFVGPGDVPYANFYTSTHRLHVDAGHSFECLSSVLGCCFLPLGLGGSGIRGRLLLDQLLNTVDYRIGILTGGNRNFQFVPHPLAGGGEVEEVSFNGDAVDE